MSETLDGIPAYARESCRGYGCIPAEYMFVGISAGKLGALKTEVPFTKDMSGRLLQRVLYHIGLSKTKDEKTLKPELVNCYITNLVKGRILDDNGNNRLPTQNEIDYWMPKFLAEVKQVNPRLILALGILVYENLIHSLADMQIWIPRLENIRYVRHPRSYGNRGAINPLTPLSQKAWDEMLAEYRLITGQVRT